jgi:hypothetical protein
MPTLQALPRLDKLRLVQFLIGEIAREEDPGMFEPGASYAIWSPYDSDEAATTLQAMLEQEQGVQQCEFVVMPASPKR